MGDEPLNVVESSHFFACKTQDALGYGSRQSYTQKSQKARKPLKERSIQLVAASVWNSSTST